LSEIVPSLISVALTPTSVAPPLSVGAFPVPDTVFPTPLGLGTVVLPPPPGVPGEPGVGAGAGADDVPAADLAVGAFDFGATGAFEPAAAGAGVAVVPAGAGVAASVAGAAGAVAGASVAGAPESGATAGASAAFGSAAFECF
jgi:hypothetical protein